MFYSLGLGFSIIICYTKNDFLKKIKVYYTSYEKHQKILSLR